MDQEGHMGSLGTSLQTLCKRLMDREKEIESKEKLYCSSAEKERELDGIQRRIADGNEKLRLLEASIRRKAEEHEKMMREYEGVVDLKERRLNQVQKSYEESRKEVETKREQLGEQQRRFEEREKELKGKEEALKSVENEIARRSCELALREKKLSVLKKLSERNLEAWNTTMENCSREFERKLRKFEGLIKDVELKEELIGSTSEELHLICKNFDECLEKAASKESDTVPLLNLTSEERLEEYLKKRDLVCGEICTVLQASDDPAMLALREIQRDSQRCSFLCDLLMKASPSITPRVKEEAMKLAHDWKAKLSVASENCLDVWNFLQFLVSYKLTSELDASELRKILGVIGVTCAASASQSSPSTCNVDKQPELIEKLIRRGEVIHAVRHVCESKLTDKFSPKQLLNDYLDDAQCYTTLVCKGRRSNSDKKRAVDKELAALTSTMECIKEFNLEAEFPRDQYLDRMLSLRNKALSYFPESELSKKRGNEIFSPRDAEQGQPKTPRMTNHGIEINSYSPRAWAKPPRGIVKLNFAFAGQMDCGFCSVVARSHEGKVLAIWYRKVKNADPLMGNVLAARGALSLASSSGWHSIYLEGDSVEAIDNLLGRPASAESISSIVSEMPILMRSFRSASPFWIPPEANVFAQNVCRWAAGADIQDDLSWIPMSDSIVSLFEKVVYSMI